jgi:inorganic pyrophosphatase
MVLLQEPTFPGCVIRCRTVGMFLMRDEVGPDEKVICVMAHDPRYAQVTDLEDLPDYERNEIEHFFQIYKETEPGKMVEKLRWAHRDEAEEEVRHSLKRWKDHVAELRSLSG